MLVGTAKFLLRCVLRLLYRVDVEGMELYDDAGDRVLIVANHTSLLDGILLYAWLPETPTFAINTQIASKPVFRPFLAFVDLFIMDPTSPLSVKSMIKFIRNDKKAVIFPEGRITVTGILMKIYEGPGMVADRADASILPIAIAGTQHSPFSYMRGSVNIRWFPKIRLRVLPPEKIHLPTGLHGNARRKAAAEAMRQLMLKVFMATYDYRKDVFRACLDAGKRNGWRHSVVEDVNRQPLTYRQLIARSFILARALRRVTCAGEHVGILLPNVVANLVTFLALLYLRRVPAMLNFTAGGQGVSCACETAAVATVFTSRKFIENADLSGLTTELERHVKLVYLEDLRDQISIVDKLLGLARSYWPLWHFRRAGAGIQPDEPALIMFTSGSEGTPKGVVLSHSNLLSNYAQVRCHIDFRLTDVLFSCLPLFHSFGLNAGCLMPLLSGCRIFLYPTPLHYRLIPELVYELGATILFSTSTFLKGYARHAHQYDFHSLRHVVAGAEKLTEDVQNTWMAQFGIRVLQGYGVTEASPVIAANTPMASKTGTVGQLLPRMQSYLAPVAGIDDGGRLVVSGPNIMLGYLLHDKPGELQIPKTERGNGWHDTGDIAAIDNDGHLSILGRAKRFAKIGGEMISLTAVEELAAELWPGFNHAAVNLPDERKGEKIVLISDNAAATRRELQQLARSKHISELHIPRKVVLADELPVLSTGKIDYISLGKLALAEDQDGSGWIRRLTNLVKKPQNRIDNDASGEATATPAQREGNDSA